MDMIWLVCGSSSLSTAVGRTCNFDVTMTTFDVNEELLSLSSIGCFLMEPEVLPWLEVDI